MPDQDDLELDVAAASGKGKKKWVLWAVLALLLIGGAVAATLLLTGNLGVSSDKPAAADKGAQAKAPAKPALYLPLSPAFVVNFEDQSDVRFLQVEVQVMAREQSVLDAVQQNMPVVRNNILLLLSGQKYEVVSTRKGKEKLRTDILNTVNKVLQDTGSSGRIEAVYFTSFVMQ